MYAQNSILCQFGPRNLSSIQQLISQPILVHFWWQLYHNPDDLTHVWDLRTIDPSLGWGGTGRVILLGDAAHAIRPTSGVGGSLAFEDVVVLCRELAECSSSAISDCIDRTIRKRQPRVTKVWQAEWDLAERMYKEENPIGLSPEYLEWLYEGV